MPHLGGPMKSAQNASMIWVASVVGPILVLAILATKTSLRASAIPDDATNAQAHATTRWREDSRGFRINRRRHHDGLRRTLGGRSGHLDRSR